MKGLKPIILFVLLLLAGTATTWAQRQVELLKGAGSLQSRIVNGEKVQLVKDKVRFKQGKTIIYCDSAYFYKSKNRLEAFGRVGIHNRENNSRIKADYLRYEGGGSIAYLRNNVVYKEGTMRLSTDILNYDIRTGSARYYEGGQIIDGQTRLNSIEGLYDTDRRYMFFKDEVLLIDKGGTRVESDTLEYDAENEVAYFKGPTVITSTDGNRLNSDDGGTYDTRSGKSNFTTATITGEDYELKGNKTDFDEKLGLYIITGQVRLYSEANEVLIFGDKARSRKEEGLTKIYGHTLMKRIVEAGDTLYLTADTLLNIDAESDSSKRLLAYNNVRIYQGGMQGKADSLSYNFTDSTITFYGDPIIWNEGSQISADTITLYIANKKLDRLFAVNNSFVISEDSLLNYNQIKGRQLTAYFAENKLNRVLVQGNGESIYFVLNDAMDGIEGMNRTLCGRMKILFESGGMSDVLFYQKPEGRLIPPQELTPGLRRLQGFAWLVSERPTLQMLFESANMPVPPATSPQNTLPVQEETPPATPVKVLPEGNDQLKGGKPQKRNGQDQPLNH